jgi:hypothetical protein
MVRRLKIYRLPRGWQLWVRLDGAPMYRRFGKNTRPDGVRAYVVPGVLIMFRPPGDGLRIRCGLV